MSKKDKDLDIIRDFNKHAEEFFKENGVSHFNSCDEAFDAFEGRINAFMRVDNSPHLQDTLRQLRTIFLWTENHLIDSGQEFLVDSVLAELSDLIDRYRAWDSFHKDIKSWPHDEKVEHINVRISQLEQIVLDFANQKKGVLIRF